MYWSQCPADIRFWPILNRSKYKDFWIGPSVKFVSRINGSFSPKKMMDQLFFRKKKAKPGGGGSEAGLAKSDNFPGFFLDPFPYLPQVMTLVMDSIPWVCWSSGNVFLAVGHRPNLAVHKDPEWKGAGWYRFTGEAGTKLVEDVVPYYHCGTSSGGSMTGGHPIATQLGIPVTRTVNFNWSGKRAFWTSSIQVINCKTHYVYYLPDVPHCHSRYCTAWKPFYKRISQPLVAIIKYVCLAVS